MSLALEPITGWTASDLARRFGAMPLKRICFDPPPGEATEEDVERLKAHQDLIYELIDGVLVRKAMSSFQSLLAIRIATLLNLYVLPRKLGWILGPDGMLRLWPGRVRIPDVCFIDRDQPPNRQFPRHQAVAELFPDLAVEILSDANTDEEMVQKRTDYFQSGTGSLVWIINPANQTADIFTAVDQHTTVGIDGVLAGDTAIPGLTIPLAKVFDIDGEL